MPSVPITRRLKNLYQPPITRLAGLWRRRLVGVARVAVTGSVAKTTTKDCLHAVLAAHGRGRASFNSTNNDYSVARTLLATRPSDFYCVQEIGASGPGSLEPLLRLFRPTVGVVTHVGNEHYVAFRGVEQVAAEKARLPAALPSDGLAVLNADDPHVAAMRAATDAAVVTFGCSGDADYRAANVVAAFPGRLGFDLHWPAGGDAPLRVATQFDGRHMLYPALAALTVGLSLGVPPDAALKALRDVVPEHGRMRRHATAGGVTFIDDSIKASYWSLPAVYDYLAAAEARRRWLVLGSVSDHTISPKRLGRRLLREAGPSVDDIVFVGDYASRVQEDEHVHGFATVAEANAFLRSELQPGDLVVLKGVHRQDHLGRLIAARDQDVRCWREDCRRDIACFECPLLTAAVR